MIRESCFFNAVFCSRFESRHQSHYIDIYSIVRQLLLIWSQRWRQQLPLLPLKYNLLLLCLPPPPTPPTPLHVTSLPFLRIFLSFFFFFCLSSLKEKENPNDVESHSQETLFSFNNTDNESNTINAEVEGLFHGPLQFTSSLETSEVLY